MYAGRLGICKHAIFTGGGRGDCTFQSCKFKHVDYIKVNNESILSLMSVDIALCEFNKFITMLRGIIKEFKTEEYLKINDISYKVIKIAAGGSFSDAMKKFCHCKNIEFVDKKDVDGVIREACFVVMERQRV